MRLDTTGLQVNGHGFDWGQGRERALLERQETLTIRRRPLREHDQWSLRPSLYDFSLPGLYHLSTGVPGLLTGSVHIDGAHPRDTGPKHRNGADARLGHVDGIHT